MVVFAVLNLIYFDLLKIFNCYYHIQVRKCKGKRKKNYINVMQFLVKIFIKTYKSECFWKQAYFGLKYDETLNETFKYGAFPEIQPKYQR